MARPKVKVKLLNDRELERALKKLLPATAKRLIRAGLKKAAEPVVAEARARAPRRTNRLAAMIEARAGKKNRKTKASRFVGTSDSGLNQGDAFYGGFIELGFLRVPSYFSQKLSRFFPRKNARPVVEPARPFLRPAFEATKAQAAKIFAAHVSKGIARVRAKGKR